MQREMHPTYNPIDSVNVSFPDYVSKRKMMESSRMSGNGLPNYAYAMDYELRKKLDAIPHLYSIGRKICATYVSRQTKLYNIHAVKVGPTQFEDVYAMGCDCAKTLGIGIPNIFIHNDQSLNAFTYAYDDFEPMIVIHSGLYERMTPGELRCIIGHECGHIHNQHGVYDMLGQILLNVGLSSASAFIPAELLNLLTLGSQIALKAWSRAAEVTCDRAGMICAEDLNDAYTSEAKLMYGAAFGEHKIDLSAIRTQLDTQVGNITKYEELVYSHPSTARRIAAEMEFAECEVLYQWRPELKTPGQVMRTKQETDNRCRKVIDLTEKG